MDDESRRIRSSADHRLRIDELGAVHAPVGRVHLLRVEQARIRELRSLHRRCERDEGTGARDVLRRLRWIAGALTGREATRVDVEPLGRIGRPTVPGAVESREGA